MCERRLEPGAVLTWQVALHEVGRHDTDSRDRGGGEQPPVSVDLPHSRWAVVVREARGELSARGDAELLIDPRQVPGDRFGAQEELVGHLPVLPAGDHQPDDALLGLGELSGGDLHCETAHVADAQQRPNLLSLRAGNTSALITNAAFSREHKCSFWE